jgi:hypothetical protein
MKKSIFLICPVRNSSEETTRKIAAYVQKLEQDGHHVHWPPRDTKQDDPVGMRICRDNGHAILLAHEVHVWYDKASQGTIFDLGMYFMATEVFGATKKLVIANPEEVDMNDGKKSFPNVLRALAAKKT